MKVLPSDRPWYLSAVVIGEYRFGLLASKLRKQREKWFQQLIDVVPVLDVNEATAIHYAAIRDQLKQDNFQIPPNDSWIAAQAIQHNLPVLSQDNHFDRIKGVPRITW